MGVSRQRERSTGDIGTYGHYKGAQSPRLRTFTVLEKLKILSESIEHEIIRSYQMFPANSFGGTEKNRGPAGDLDAWGLQTNYWAP